MPLDQGPKLQQPRPPRSASADLWRQTLSQIPSIFGRLVYLSTLRDPNSGRYQHHGLAAVFGEDQAQAALKASHEETFGNWLDFPLEQQRSDLDVYFSSLNEPVATILTNWDRLRPYRNLPPDTSRTAECQLFFADLEVLLTLMRHELGVSLPDPDA